MKQRKRDGMSDHRDCSDHILFEIQQYFTVTVFTIILPTLKKKIWLGESTALLIICLRYPVMDIPHFIYT